MKKHRTSFSLIFSAILFICANIKEPTSYKSAFYDAIASNDTSKINQQISVLSNLNIDSKLAYTGALLMKKSGLVKSAQQKLTLFKAGRKKLEEAISQEKENGEYRFLRLMIQENCPPMLKYNAQIQEDLKKITNSYKNFDPVIKTAVLNYSKKSKYLKESDL